MKHVRPPRKNLLPHYFGRMTDAVSTHLSTVFVDNPQGSDGKRLARDNEGIV
jgi:hypothetical protein